MWNNQSEDSKELKKLVVKLSNELDYKNQLLTEKDGLTLERFATLTSMLEEKDRLLQESSAVVGALMAQAHRLQQALDQVKEKFECVKQQMEKRLQDLEAQKDDQSGEMQHLRCHNEGLKTQLLIKRKQLEETTQELSHIESLNHSLMLKEHANHEDLQAARAEATNCLLNMGNGTKIGIKRMGEIDPQPFQGACSKKFGGEYWAEIFDKLYATWNENLSDSSWNPFKKEVISGKLSEVVDEKDERLTELRKEWGDEVYGIVVNALTELKEYSPGRTPTPVVWNFYEGRKAHLKEVIEYITQCWETCNKKDGEKSATIANLIAEKERLTKRFANVSALLREKDKILKERYAMVEKLMAEDANKVKQIDKMSVIVTTLTEKNDALLGNYNAEMRRNEEMMEQINKLKCELQSQKDEFGKQMKQLTEKIGGNGEGRQIVAVKMERMDWCGSLMDHVEPLSMNLEGSETKKAKEQDCSAAEDRKMQDQNMRGKNNRIKGEPDMPDEQLKASQPTTSPQIPSLKVILSSTSHMTT